MAGMSSPNSPTYTPSGTTPTAGGKGPASSPSQYTPSPGGQYGVSSDALNRYSATNQGLNPAAAQSSQYTARPATPPSTGMNKGFKSGGAVREISEKDIKQLLDALRVAREVVIKGK